MTKFQKALKSYSAGMLHAQRHVGFKKSDVGDTYMADKMLDGKKNFARQISTKKYKFPKLALKEHSMPKFLPEDMRVSIDPFNGERWTGD